MPGNSLIACTSRAPAANDPVRKYAFAPSPSTRQSSTPSDSRNCVGLIWSVIRPSLSCALIAAQTNRASIIPTDHDSPLDIRERQGSRFRLDRVARRSRKPAPGLDRQSPRRTPPCSDDISIDEDCARPDSSRPERAAKRGIGDQEATIASLEKEVRIAAREEPCGRRGPRGLAHRRLIAREDPRVAYRCSYGGEPPTELTERRDAARRPNPCPLSERLRRRGTEDVQVSTRQL